MIRPGLDNSRAPGWFAEWHWLAFTLLSSIRACLNASDQDLRAGRYVLFLQPERVGPDQRPSFADFEVRKKGVDRKQTPFLRGEYKLTRVKAMEALRDAVEQVLNPEPTRPDRVMVIVGTYGEASGRLLSDDISSELMKKGVEIISITQLEGLRGCHAAGKFGPTHVEVFITDANYLYDFFAATLLAPPGLSKAAEKLGALAAEILRPATAHPRILGEILKSGEDGIDLSLREAIWTNLPLESNALFDLLQDSRGKLLYDLSRMSVANHQHDRWTHTLFRLSNLDSSADALEHALHPLPVHLSGEHRRDAEELLFTSRLPAGAGSVRIVIESRAGAGKTTMLAYMKWLRTRDLYHHHGFSHDVVVPFLLDLQTEQPFAGPGKLFPLVLADLPPYFHDKSNVFAGGLANTALEVVLSLWEVDIFVDGYDHLRGITDLYNSLNDIGDELAKEKVRIRRLIVTSRPGHQAETLWESQLHFKSRKISNAGIDQYAVNDYIKSWWAIVAKVDVKNYDERFGINAPIEHAVQKFNEYVMQSGPEFAAIIRSTPLLLAIVLATFLQTKHKRLGKNESALFEDLISIDGRQKMDVIHLEQLCFALMMAPTSILGAFGNNSKIVIVGRKMPVGEWREAWEMAPPWDECTFIDSEGEGDNRRWAFLHPSFEEFLACRYFAEHSKRGSGDEIPGPNQLLVAPEEIVTRDGFIGSVFSEVFTRLGSQALKFILGRVSAEPVDLEKLEALLDWLAGDYGLQQYLYDTECLRPAGRELEACLRIIRGDAERSGAARREALLHKLRGHMLYANFGDGESQKALNESIACCVKRKFQGSEWYRLFCYDHIQNRTKNEEEAEANQKEFAKLLSEMEVAGTHYVLRSAHFAGHLGNQALRKIDSIQILQLDKLAGLIEHGEEQYTKALELRAVAFAECVSPDKSDPEAQTMVMVRNRFLQTSKQELPPQQRANAVSGGTAKERFMGPCQAIGDFANQLAGRAAIRFWKVLEQRKLGTGVEADWMGKAEADLSLAREYWELANDQQVRGARGEQISKYVIYLAGVHARRNILLHRRPWIECHDELLAEMSRLSREFRVSMPEKQDSRSIVPGVERFFREAQATPNN